MHLLENHRIPLRWAMTASASPIGRLMIRVRWSPPRKNMRVELEAMGKAITLQEELGRRWHQILLLKLNKIPPLIIETDITIFMKQKRSDQRMIILEPLVLLEQPLIIMLLMVPQDMRLTKEGEMIIKLSNTTQLCSWSQSTTQIWISFKKLRRTSLVLAVPWQGPIREKEVS